MTIFESIKSKNIDELTERIDEYGMYDCSPWIDWFDSTYCQQCSEESFYDEESDVETVCTYCEYYNKCRFFEHMDEVPDSKQIIKMWLKLESWD